MKECIMDIFENEDFASVCIFAVRYSFGRATYAPSLVCRYVEQHLIYFTKKDLYVLIQDIEGYIDACIQEDLLFAESLPEDVEDWKKLLEIAKTEYSNRTS